jgi:hypothetical protein
VAPETIDQNPKFIAGGHPLEREVTAIEPATSADGSEALVSVDDGRSVPIATDPQREDQGRSEDHGRTLKDGRGRRILPAYLPSSAAARRAAKNIDELKLSDDVIFIQIRRQPRETLFLGELLGEHFAIIDRPWSASASRPRSAQCGGALLRADEMRYCASELAAAAPNGSTMSIGHASNLGHCCPTFLEPRCASGRLARLRCSGIA